MTLEAEPVSPGEALSGKLSGKLIATSGIDRVLEQSWIRTALELRYDFYVTLHFNKISTVSL